MTDRDQTGRRAFLTSLAAASVGLAGCSSIGGNSDQTGTPTGTPTGTATPTETGTATQTPEQSETETPGEQTKNQPNDPGSYAPMEAKAASFENLDFWTAHSGVTLEADTQTAYAGTQSARVEGRSGTIERGFPVPIDLSNRDLSITMKIAGPVPTNLRVILYDTGGNATELIQGYHGELPEGWVRVNPSINSAGADMTSISRLLITLDGGGAEKKYWVDDIRFHDKTSKKAQVMPTFDYMTRSIYEVVFPEMQKRGLTGTVAVAADRVGNADRISVEELQEMKSAGWEIASMSNDFEVLAGQSKDIQRKRIKRGKELIEGWELGEPTAIMYPKGFADDNTVEVAQEFHDLGFTSFNASELGLSQSAIMGPRLVNRSRPSTAEALKNQLQPAVDYSGLYTPQQNQIGPNADNDRAVLQEMLDALERRKKQGDIEIVHPSDVVLNA
jgi:hypothetical protein